MLANYHTHTPRCGHATGTEREYIERAIEKGMKVLGFSDHTPQPYPEDFHSGMRMGMDEIENYTGTLSALKEEYKDDIRILIGYEVEYTHRFFDTLLNELQKYPLDYLIMGQHMVPDEIDGFYTGSPTDEEERLKAYVDLVTEGMETGNFLYVAHPDIINFTGSDEIYEKHMSRLIETSNKLGMPIEINLLGFREKRHYPCDKFFSLASRMGAKFILGCDAHNPKFIENPEDIEGLDDFVKLHNITLIKDNLLDI